MHIYIHAYIHVCTCIHIYIYIVCTCIHIYIYIFTCIFTHMCIYTYIPEFWRGCRAYRVWWASPGLPAPHSPCARGQRERDWRCASVDRSSCGPLTTRPPPPSFAAPVSWMSGVIHPSRQSRNMRHVMYELRQPRHRRCGWWQTMMGWWQRMMAGDNAIICCACVIRESCRISISNWHIWHDSLICHILMSRVIYEWVVWHVNESCDMSMSCVTYAWVLVWYV